MTFKEAFTSERMVFGFLIIVGFITSLIILICYGPKLPSEIVSLIAGAMGALGASVGIITQAIWKSDRTDAKQADTANILAAKAPDLSGTGPSK